MWIIKYALAAVVLLAVMYFSFQNAQETTSITLWKYYYAEVHLVMIIFASFAVGVVFWFLVSMYQYFKVSAKVSDLRKKNKQLLDEIKALRNLPLEEVAPQDMVEDEGENR
jgi:uncharacterized membrane protein YciS (DUF1049 family)